MKGSSKRIMSILASIGLLLASVAVLSYFIQPAYQEIKDARAEVASRQKLANEYDASAKRVKSLMSQYQDVLRFQETISQVLPVEQNYPQSVNQVATLASINNLNVRSLALEQQSIKPSSRPNLAKGIGSLRINARLIGSYEDFRNFLQNLETNVNLLDLTNLKIEPTEPSKLAQNKFIYAISIDTYYQAE